MIRIILFSLLLLATGDVAAAQLYKCTDDRGNTQYVPQKIAGQDCEPMRVRSSGGDASREQGSGEEGGDGQEGEDGGSDQQALEKEIRQRQCEKWTEALQSYREADFLTKKDPETGEERRMTAEEMAAEIVKAERMVEQNCGDGGDGR